MALEKEYSKSKYRNYTITDELDINERNKLEQIHDTYRKQRTRITYSFNQYLINKYCCFQTRSSFWSLFALLDNITDLSDPDTALPNSIHALQTAEAIRLDTTREWPEWMPLVGLIHDMGKILFLHGCDEDGTSRTTQWAIVGDTFITGAPLPDSLVLAEYNKLNPDHVDGIIKYFPGCGLKNTSIAFGHDEYMYRLLVANGHKMPCEAEYIVRYHSLYAWHSSDAYDYLQDKNDIQMKKIVKEFNEFDLYTKNDSLPREWTHKLRTYYSGLVMKYISQSTIIRW
jgi:inositol oxygenase